jgi:hypothetical protein
MSKFSGNPEEEIQKIYSSLKKSLGAIKKVFTHTQLTIFSPKFQIHTERA